MPPRDFGGAGRVGQGRFGTSAGQEQPDRFDHDGQPGAGLSLGLVHQHPRQVPVAQPTQQPGAEQQPLAPQPFRPAPVPWRASGNPAVIAEGFTSRLGRPPQLRTRPVGTSGDPVWASPGTRLVTSMVGSSANSSLPVALYPPSGSCRWGTVLTLVLEAQTGVGEMNSVGALVVMLTDSLRAWSGSRCLKVGKGSPPTNGH
jgi:hypothetical protein